MIFLDLLATLDAKELAAFDKHLRTAHAKELIALRAFAHFKQFHPRFEDEAQLDLDFVVRKLQRQGAVAEQFDRKQLSNTCSDLYGWLKDFLLLKKARDKSLESEYLWLTVLRERGMAAAHGRAEAALLKRALSAPKHDVWAYCRNMAAHYADCFDTDRHKDMEPGEVIEALTACRLALEQFYETCRRKVNCELLNRYNQEGTAAQLGDAPPEEPLTMLYCMAEALFSGGGMAEYEALEAAMARFAEIVAKNELLTVWTYLKNYNSHKLLMGDQAAWERLGRLDRFALQYGLLQDEQNRVSTVQFFNMINTAAKHGEYQHAASLTADYLATIEEGKRYEVSILADAILLFSQKRYEEVYQQLKKFEDYRFREPHLAIRYRLLKLISLYELDMDHGKLFNDAVNFEAFLRRSENPWKKAAKASLAFTRFYKRLILGKTKAKQVLTEIKTAKSLFFRDWLLEKFENHRLVK